MRSFFTPREKVQEAAFLILDVLDGNTSRRVRFFSFLEVCASPLAKGVPVTIL